MSTMGWIAIIVVCFTLLIFMKRGEEKQDQKTSLYSINGHQWLRLGIDRKLTFTMKLENQFGYQGILSTNEIIKGIDLVYSHKEFRTRNLHDAFLVVLKSESENIKF